MPVIMDYKREAEVVQTRSSEYYGARARSMNAWEDRHPLAVGDLVRYWAGTEWLKGVVVGLLEGKIWRVIRIDGVELHFIRQQLQIL